MPRANEKSEPIERPRLTERFLRGLSRRLTVVEAPLGYGKTTLIRAWVTHLEAADAKVKYLSFEGLARGQLEHVTNALTRLGLHFDECTGLDDATDHADSEHTLAECRYLVLDDFHEADAACVAFVQTILREPEPSLHLIIGSREPPGIALTKLRMTDQVNDFTTEDLRFDLSEAQALFQNDMTLDEVEANLLRSEGWAAALQLLRQFGMNPGERPPDFDELSEFANYLNEQYFEQLSQDQRHLLLNTAHVEKLDGDLANRLTGRSNGWTELAHLSRSNALIFEEVKATSTTYRYLQLLRDFLRRKQQQLGQKRLAELHDTTSVWFAECDALFETMQHACLSGRPQRAETLLLDAGGVQVGMLQGAGLLAACLDLLSGQQVYSSPRLLVAQAYVFLKTGRIKDGTELLAELRRSLEPDQSLLEREIILVEAHARAYSDKQMSRRQLDALEHTIASTPSTDPLMRGLLSNFLCMFLIESGDFQKAQDFGERAMAHYRDISAKHLQFFMHLHLATIELEIGQLHNAYRARSEAMDLCMEHFSFDPSLRAIARIYLDETAFEAGETVGVADRLQTALRRIDRLEGWNMLYLAGYETCLGLLAEDGDIQSSVDLLEHAGSLVARRGMQLFSNQLLAMQLDLAVRAGARLEARRLASEIDRLLADTGSEAGLRWRGRVRAELSMARYEADNKAEGPALKRVQRVAKFCAAKGLRRLELRALVRKFCLAFQTKDLAMAETTLNSCLALMRCHGGLGAILRERTAFKEAALWLVSENGVGKFEPDDIALLADALWHASIQSVGTRSSILAELLTERELEVLEELAKGSANKVIARALQVTEPTVKFHLKNIYRKIGVNSRKLAIEIARKYG